MVFQNIPIHLLKFAAIYRGLQSLVSNKNSLEDFVTSYIQPTTNDAILDVGCGDAKILQYLQVANYLGIDHNSRYIDKAKSRYGHRGTFIVGDVDDIRQHVDATFDKALVLSVLHHLDDDQCVLLLKQVSGLLKPGGAIVTIDPVLGENRNPIAHLLMKMDRGRFIRTRFAYEKIFEKSSVHARTIVRTDLLRLPYANAISTLTPE